LLALAVFNMIVATEQWFTWLPLLLLMPLSIWIGVRAILQNRAQREGTAPVERDE